MLLLCILLYCGNNLYAQKEDLTNGFIQYVWKQGYYVYLNGQKALFFSSRMPYSKIAAVDIDEDEDQDLFIGTGDGTLAYVENIGSRTQHDLELKNRRVTFMDADNQIRFVQFSGAISPAFFDFDHDGDFDLFILDAYNTIHLFENAGNRKNPLFRISSKNYLKIQNARIISFSFVDLNSDGLKDLAFGTKDGTLAYIPNTGSIKLANFSSRPQVLMTLKTQQELSPAFEDWDHDGKTDVFIGTLTGDLKFFKNVGTPDAPKFAADSTVFNYESDIYGYSAPIFVDLNGDGNNDLIVGNITDKIRYYEYRKGAQGENTIWHITDNLLNFNSPINAGKRSSVVIKDVNDDGIADMLTGEEDGKINLFINQNSNKKVPNYYQAAYDLLPKLAARYGIPDLGDLNGDGFPDMILCSRSGRVIYLAHNGSKSEPNWRVENYNFYNLSENEPCAPRLLDFDYDGDTDMFLSTADGYIRYFKNIGDKTTPKMMAFDFPYGEEKFNGFYVPAFINWRRNGVMSMLLGGPKGNLSIILDPLKREYAEVLNNLKKLNTVNFSLFTNHTPEKLSHLPALYDQGLILPYTADFNDDGEPDILYGTESGSITYLQNIGYEFYKPRIAIELPTYNNLPPIFENRQTWLQTKFNRVTVTVGDIDGDNDEDIVFGNQSGDLYWVQNTGTKYRPKFSEDSMYKLLTTGLDNVSPNLHDLDGDGDLDMIVGSKTGELSLYENTGGRENFNFVPIRGALKHFRVSKNAVPAVYSNFDGRLTIITGDLMGHLNLVSGGKTLNGSWQFKLLNRISLNTDVGLGASPYIADMDIDAIPEIIIGSDSGRLKVLKSNGPFLSGEFISKNDYLPKETLPEGTYPAIADFDGDNDADMIIGTQNGMILYFNNTAIND